MCDLFELRVFEVRLAGGGGWSHALAFFLFLSMAIPFPAVSANAGLHAYCSEGVEVGEWATRDCRPVADRTLDALYSRVATGAHEEYRALNKIVVVRKDEPGQWEFLTKGGEIHAVIHRGAPDVNLGGKGSVAVFCGDAPELECSKIARDAFREFPPLAHTFPLPASYHARGSDSPMTDVSACTSTPACLDPKSAPAVYPAVSKAACISGTAVVMAYVDAGGCVCDAAIQESSRNRDLDRAAMNAVEQWRFPAATQVVGIPIAFRASACTPTSETQSDNTQVSTAQQSLMQAYVVALQTAIESRWLRPAYISPSASCKVKIRQLPGGEVVDLWVQPDCEYDEIGRHSIEAAVLKAQPLPYKGFESAFRRDLVLTFRTTE